MPNNVKLYFDQTGLPRAKGEVNQESLASFLECDIQSNKDLLLELLKQTKLVSDKKIPGFETKGKAHQISITEDEVIIDPLYDPGIIPSQLSHIQFITILSRWLSFLNQASS
jgi:hypothetical protein